MFLLAGICLLVLLLDCRAATAAIQRDVLTASSQTAASTALSTPAFTTASGQELLLAFIATDKLKTPNTTVQSVSGAGLTWTLVVRTNVESGSSEIWRAFSSTALKNVKVTANLSQSVVASLTVMSFVGASTSGTNGSGAIGAVASGYSSKGAPRASLVTTQSDSLILGVGNDYDNPLSRTPLTGQTLVNQVLSSTGDTYWVQQVNAQTAAKGTTVTVGDSAPASDQYNLSICEVVPAVSAVTPNLALSTTNMAFGSVVDSNSSTSTLTLSSTGTGSVTITSLSVSGAGFSAGSLSMPRTLSPGQTLAVPVTFSPSQAGAVTGKLTVVSNSVNSPTATATLTGSGVAVTRQVSLSTTSINYGSVSDGSSKTMSFTATSSGNSAVTLNSLKLSGAGFSVGTTSGSVTLQPGQSVAVPVTFAPQKPGTATGSIAIGSNSTDVATSTVALAGTGTAMTPSLTISSSSLSFGNINQGSSKAMTLTLTSSGTSAVTVNSVGISGTSFTLGPATLPMTLQVGQSLTLQITFAPQSAGSLTGLVTVNSNSSSGVTATVSLSGTGIATTTPKLSLSATSLSFGSVTEGSSANQTVTLSSTGTAAVTVSSAQISGSGFSLVGGTFPITLNPGASTSVAVQFAPGTTGTLSGQLIVNSNSSTGASIVVALSGFGEAAVTHSVDLTWLAPTSSSDPVSGYHVYRAAQGGAFVLLNPTLESQTAYTDNNVTSGSTYIYQVKSVDASGIESVASNQFTATIP